MQTPILYRPIEGKTYSLFGKSNSTTDYYHLIENLAHNVLAKEKNPKILLKTIQNYSKKKRTIQKIARTTKSDSLISYIINLINKPLSEYTSNVEAHLKTLPYRKLWDSRLRTIRLQYHLYMLEIELSNQIFISQFLDADIKIALLPHCLRDFKTECKSSPNEFDYQCKYCSKNCYENYISRLLKKYNVDPYIWMSADIKKKAKEIYKNKQSLGIIGIACIPELAWGLRKCQKYEIPAIGIPLDTNRCQRWMGEFKENSVNLDQLELLVSASKSSIGIEKK
jgi:hypothetical protein